MELVKTGKQGKWEHYMVLPSSVASMRAQNEATVITEYGSDSSSVFPDEDEVEDVKTMQLLVGGKQYQYVPWGDDDDTPMKIRHMIADNMVTSQCMSFDILSCYGQGVRFVNRDEERRDTDDPDIRDFCMANSLHECFMEQSTDMKYYFFSVSEIILDRSQQKIVRIKHLDSCFCRLEKREKGKIGHVFYGNFKNNSVPIDAVAIPLLDPIDPLGDLRVRLGKVPDPQTGKKRTPENCYKYAVLCRMPTPGCQYYPMAYYMSIFRDNWYDIYRLIGLGKKYMIKNTSAPRIQIEVHEDYWQNLCDYEGITDPEKRKARIVQEQCNLRDFVCGPENAGKALISNYYVDPNGKENRTVPASSQRVDALESQIRIERERNYGNLLESLREIDGWGTQPQAACCIQTPHFNINNIGEPGGLSLEDWSKIKGFANEDKIHLQNLISRKQVEEILVSLRCPYDFSKAYYYEVANRWSQITHSRYRQSIYVSHYVSGQWRDLMDFIEDNIDNFPIYKDSKEYKANHYERYQNTKDSAAFIFAG